MPCSLRLPPSLWNPSADRASMDRKSRILIVGFFNYIQVISHGKVGGKVCRERQDSTFQSYSSTSNQVSFSINDTQFSTSANQFQQSEFQDTCHLAWYTRILACPRPLPRLPSTTATSTTARLTSASPLSLLTIEITISCLLGGFILESRRLSLRGIILGCLRWAVLRSC